MLGMHASRWWFRAEAHIHGAGAVQGGLNRGFSLILNRLNMRHPPVTSACDEIEQFFGVQCNANLYVTPAVKPDDKNERGVNQGFEIHWDEMESFAVQIAGRKHW